MEVVNTVKVVLGKYFQDHRDEIMVSKGPRLEVFAPAEVALLGSLWKPQWSNVPVRQSSREQDGFIGKSRPYLLLHGLDNPNAQISQPDAHKHIHAAQQYGPTFLYGTSGAGKTRTVFEYLSRNKGFYLLSDDFERNPGSRDLLRVLDCHLPTARENDTVTNEENRKKVEALLSMLLFVRYAVHEKLTALLGDLSPYEWLLYQLFPQKLLGEDVFFLAVNACVARGLNELVHFHDWGSPVTNVWSIFVDEAQALLDMNKINFLSKDGTKRRSAFSAVMGGLGEFSKRANYLHYPVFSGTGLAFDQLSEQTLSIVGKSLGDDADLFFAGFKLLEAEHVQEYMRQILDVSGVSPDVLTHVANWLRGRPRWTAGFLEVYCSRREKKSYTNQVWRTQGEFHGVDAKLMEALDRYLNVMTSKEEPRNRREAWSAGRASAYACFERVQQKIVRANESQRPLLTKVKNDLEYAVCRFAIGQNPHSFTHIDAKFLIESGVVAVCESDREGTVITGHIDEPLVVQSGINFFDLDDHLGENLEKQEHGGYGEAFERLLLPGLLMEKKKLHDFLKSHLNDDAGALDAYGVPRRSAYGVLCVDTRGAIDKTIDWVTKSIAAKFEGQVAPFCYPDVHIGPDVTFLLRNHQNYEDFRACIIQSKYVADVADVDNQQEALRTLDPSLLYHQSRGKPEKERISEKLTPPLIAGWNLVKDEFISDARPCLRLLVQMPAEPTASAVSGNVPAEATGPTSKSKRQKRDLLVVVDNDNANELFSQKTAAVVRLLKRPKII